MEELLDQTEETEINHSRRIAIIFIITCVLTIILLISIDVGVFENFNSQFSRVLLMLSIPVSTSLAAIISAYPKTKQQVKHLDNGKPLIYSLLPFAFILVFMCYIMLDEFKTSGINLNTLLEISSILILFGSLPSTIIYSIIKAQSLFLLNKPWLHIIPLCLVLLGTISFLLYYLINQPAF